MCSNRCDSGCLDVCRGAADARSSAECGVYPEALLCRRQC